MAKNVGKIFESDFAVSVDTSYCFLHRLNDSAQSYNNNRQSKFSWCNPCDYYLFNSISHQLFAIECKTTSGRSMSFQVDENDKSSKNIKYHQIKSLTDMSKYDGIIAGFLLNFRDEKNDTQRTYFQLIADFNRMTKEINKVSFNEMDLILYNAKKIQGVRKRTRYKWDINSFLKSMTC